MRAPTTRLVRSLAATLAALSVLLALALPAHADGPPTVGAPAPVFRLQDQAGAWHALADYRGQWVVLYFYPKDETPGCTTEACEFRDNLFAFRDLGATVLGVSVDDVDSHKKFATKEHLPFTLLADPSKQTAKDYGVLSNYGLFQIASRQTFILDPQGRIAKHYASVDPKEHSKTVLADLKALRSARKG